MNITRRGAIAGGLAGIITSALPLKESSAVQVEAGTFRLSMQPWIGYALWYVAQDLGIFARYGLSVQFINYTDDADGLAILESGAIQGTNAAVQNVLQDFSVNGRLATVMLEDTSTSADAILAPTSLKSVSNLIGKSVAYEFGSTSNILLAAALDSVRLRVSAVKSVNIPAAEAAAALIAGRVDAAVTYEPYVSAAMTARSDIWRLFTAAQAPGLITDCFVVTRGTLASRPGQVRAMLLSWGAAQQEYYRDPKRCQAIMAKGIGSDPDALGSTFGGLHYYSLPESKQLLSGQFKTNILPRANNLCVEIGLVKKMINPESIIDLQPLDSV